MCALICAFKQILVNGLCQRRPVILQFNIESQTLKYFNCADVIADSMTWLHQTDLPATLTSLTNQAVHAAYMPLCLENENSKGSRMSFNDYALTNITFKDSVISLREALTDLPAAGL